MVFSKKLNKKFPEQKVISLNYFLPVLIINTISIFFFLSLSLSLSLLILGDLEELKGLIK